MSISQQTLKSIAQQAVNDFNGHPETSQQYAHRLLTKQLSAPQFHRLTPEQRSQLRDDLDQYVQQSLDNHIPEKTTNIEPPWWQKLFKRNAPTPKPTISDTEIKMMVADVFHTTIDGSEQQRNYLASLARERVGRYLHEKNVTGSDKRKIMKLCKDEIDSNRGIAQNIANEIPNMRLNKKTQQ